MEDNLYEIYKDVKDIIRERTKKFENIYLSKDNEAAFLEFVFCLLTPQTNASVAWNVVSKLYKHNVLINGKEEELIVFTKPVRFYKTKAKRIVENRKLFLENNTPIVFERFPTHNPLKLREFLVNKIKGYGFKEASHFLRNIGMGSNIAIIDRHILRFLQKNNLITEIPKTISPKRYLEFEKIYLNFAEKLNITPVELDLLILYLARGEVFK